MKKAAVVFRNQGPEAAVKVLGVKGFNKLNKIRKEAFTSGGGSAIGDMTSGGTSGYDASATSGYYPSSGLQTLVSPSSNGAGLGVTPWWTKWMNTGQADIAPAQETASMSPFGLGLGVLDLGWDPMKGRHMTTKPSSFPKLFGYGGDLAPINIFSGYGGSFLNGAATTFKPGMRLESAPMVLTWRNGTRGKARRPYSGNSRKRTGSYSPSLLPPSIEPEPIVEKVNNSLWNDYVESPNAFNPISLSEVVVSPTQDTWDTVKRFSNAIPDKAIRTGVNDYLSSFDGPLSSNDMVNRFLDLYTLIGSPTVGYNITDRSMTPYTVRNTNPLYYPAVAYADMFTPGLQLGTFIYTNMKDIMLNPKKKHNPYDLGFTFFDEVPHVIQYNSKFNNGTPFSSYMPWTINTGQFSDFEVIPGSGRTSYEQRGAFENQAHSIIKPMMLSYLTGVSPDYAHRVGGYFNEHDADDNDAWFKQNQMLYNLPVTDIDDMRRRITDASKTARNYGTKNS